MKNLGAVREHGVFKELKEDQCDSCVWRVDGVDAGNTRRKHSIEQARLATVKVGVPLTGFSQESEGGLL